MRKRQAKKISKHKCLKCGCSDGVNRWDVLKTGKYVSTRLYCWHCDIGVPRGK